MGLDAPHSVDAIGIDNQDGAVVLNLLDGWDWSAPSEHLAALTKKLEAYLNFALSGQIVEEYPQGTDRAVRIEVVLKHAPPPDAVKLFDRVVALAKEHEIQLLWREWSGAKSPDAP